MTRIKQIDPFCWEIPKDGDMRVPGRIYADEQLLSVVEKEEVIKQVVNVATLPGIVSASLAMPDIHWGYGFPIGGVAAFDWQTGVVSPGGVGYDINCGVRLARTQLTEDQARNKLEDLVNELFKQIPCGVGSTGWVKLTRSEEKKVLKQGSQWAVKNGFGVAEDVVYTEDHGCMADADPKVISDRA
ncbi:MAG: RtcB family protein, partial [Desulfobacteraceae bacterium]